MKFLFPKRSEKGQGLVEYALILVLVAIVVIAALMILGPLVEQALSGVNEDLATQEVVSAEYTNPANISLLSDAQFVKAGHNSPYLISSAAEGYTPIYFEEGCHKLDVPDGYRVKFGTASPYNEGYLGIVLADNMYTLCNSTPDTKIGVVIVFLELPR